MNWYKFAQQTTLKQTNKPLANKIVEEHFDEILNAIHQNKDLKAFIKNLLNKLNIEYSNSLMHYIYEVTKKQIKNYQTKSELQINILNNNYEDIKKLIQNGYSVKYISEKYNTAPYLTTKFIKEKRKEDTTLQNAYKQNTEKSQAKIKNKKIIDEYVEFRNQNPNMTFQEIVNHFSNKYNKAYQTLRRLFITNVPFNEKELRSGIKELFGSFSRILIPNLQKRNENEQFEYLFYFIKSKYPNHSEFHSLALNYLIERIKEYDPYLLKF